MTGHMLRAFAFLLLPLCIAVNAEGVEAELELTANQNDAASQR